MGVSSTSIAACAEPYTSQSMSSTFAFETTAGAANASSSESALSPSSLWTSSTGLTHFLTAGAATLVSGFSVSSESESTRSAGSFPQKTRVGVEKKALLQPAAFGSSWFRVRASWCSKSLLGGPLRMSSFHVRRIALSTCQASEGCPSVRVLGTTLSGAS